FEFEIDTRAIVSGQRRRHYQTRGSEMTLKELRSCPHSGPIGNHNVHYQPFLEPRLAQPVRQSPLEQPFLGGQMQRHTTSVPVDGAQNKPRRKPFVPCSSAEWLLPSRANPPWSPR